MEIEGLLAIYVQVMSSDECELWLTQKECGESGGCCFGYTGGANSALIYRYQDRGVGFDAGVPCDVNCYYAARL